MAPILPCHPLAREHPQPLDLQYGEGEPNKEKPPMTAEPIEATPPPRAWTVDDLDDLPDDGHRREILDGVLLVSPSPGTAHQVIAGRLMVALEETCPPEYHVSLGVDVRINRHRVLCPDVMVSTAEAASRRHGRYEPHEIILAAEVVSPTSEAMDRILKPTLYAQAGIPFYWRIEITDHVAVHVYKLNPSAEVYARVGEFTDTIDLAEPWPITILIKRLTPRFLPPPAAE
jgi:Uma2 family endonuclease